MQSFKILLYLTFFLTLSTWAAPSPASVKGFTTLSQRATLEQRQQGEIVAAIIDAASKVATSIFDDVMSDIHTAESAFTRRTVSALRKTYPDKNIVMYHNPESIADFDNDVHTHVEKELMLGTTQGYEIHVFDKGTFWLAGDGGYENWMTDGNYVRGDDGTLTYSPVN
ncbi:MAG: hypothetical protein Q9160_005345 [Pyrenula sp. 1 TL-2023]